MGESRKPRQVLRLQPQEGRRRRRRRSDRRGGAEPAAAARVARIHRQQLLFGATRRPRLRDASRRVLNVLIAAIGILVALPAMILVAIAIRFSSKGPVVYSQVRVGMDRRSARRRFGDCRRQSDLGGKPFTMYKFRTMVTGADKTQQWATVDDPRVTSVGRVLRKYRLDELPQLFNVLRGDMNVVGPRPEQPEIFAHLRTSIANYETRQRVRPGITGLAQVKQGYDTSVEDVERKLDFDLDYLVSRSTARDLRVMLATLPVMVFKKGSR
ncbi:MAG: sugar transferase [Gemmatimonadota bacterium]|nr:MAG: sugar transferase [Gemmatimonadota bacterium]